MDRRYRFERMDLLRSPGFPAPPFGTLTDFSPQLNILYGPNGIGKSTLIRAMRALLSKSDGGRAIDAEATVKSGDETYALSLAHGHLTQHNSQTGEPVSLPARGDELSDAYFFGLHELLSDIGDNPLFIERVQSEMQGGINLEAARERSKNKAITKFPSSNITESKEEALALEEVERIKGEIAKNSDLLDQIAAITALLDEESEVRGRELLLKGALAYRAKSDEATDLKQQIDGFDQRLASFSASTATDLETRQGRYDRAVSEEREAREAVAEAHRIVENEQLPARFLENAQVTEEIQTRIDRVQHAQRAHEEAEGKRREADAALASWQSELSWLVGEAPDRATLESMVQTLSSLAQQCEPLRIRVATTAQIHRALGAVDGSVEARLKEMEGQRGRAERLVALTARLNEASSAGEHRLWWLPVALFATSAILALFWQPSALIGAALATIAALYVRRGKERRLSDELRREIAEVRTLLGESNPSGDWSAEGVARLLGTISGEIGRLTEQRAKNERIGQAAVDAEEARTLWSAWLEEWKEASASLHLLENPLLDGAQFFNFSQSLVTWLERKETAAMREANLAAAAATLLEEREHLRAFCLLESVADDQLVTSARQLSKRIGDTQNLKESLKERENRLRLAEEALDRERDELSAFYAHLGFLEWDSHGVLLLCSRWEAYAALVEQYGALQRDLERYSDEERRCGSEQSEASLALLLEEVEGTLAALSNKKRELGQLEERYRAMSDSPVLEEAVHNHQSKAADLEAHRRAAVRGRVVQALYERIKEERERYYQPQVVKNASTWLSRITHGRYTMGVGEDNFIAIDSVNDRPYQLAELSSGTRIQLLFSIRMAFLELLEEGRSQHLPIFFDELMANSDDERSIAISEAIATISGTRQVFYATAQLDETEKLRSVAKGSVRLFDLESIREERAIERRPFLPVSPKAVEVIDPIADYNGYGEALSVARPALFEPVGGVHSWYLATESGELYALLVRGLARIGQSAASDPAYQRRYTLLRHAARLAEQGRPRPIRTFDLSDESLPISRDVGYFRQIEEFLSSGEQSGNDLVKALEDRTIKGMRDSMRTLLIEWLLEKGYATDQSPLAREDILSALALDYTDLDVRSSDYLVVDRYLMALGIQ